MLTHNAYIHVLQVRRVHMDMSVHNVASWFIKADDYGLENVRTATLSFLARNLARIKAQVMSSQT
jgi:hypothetical protein